VESCFDSFKLGAVAGVSSFFSLGSVAGGLGLPPGNAVLNFPVNRIASGYSVPEGAKELAICSPDIRASMGSTSCESLEEWMSTVSFKPGAGDPPKTPAKAMTRLPAFAVAMSSLFIAFSFSAKTAGARPCAVWPRKSRSARTCESSKVMPHAEKS